MKKFLFLFFTSVVVFSGCVAQNPIVEKVSKVNVDVGNEADDSKVSVDAKEKESVPVETPEVKAEAPKEVQVPKEPEASDVPVEPKTSEVSDVPAESEVPEVVVQTRVVMISDFAYVSSSVTINKGDSVVWKHNDVAPHDIVSVDGLFKSSVLEKGGSFSFKFENAGTYEYYCSIHPSMKGTIVVQ